MKRKLEEGSSAPKKRKRAPVGAALKAPPPPSQQTHGPLMTRELLDQIDWEEKAEYARWRLEAIRRASKHGASEKK